MRAAQIQFCQGFKSDFDIWLQCRGICPWNLDSASPLCHCSTKSNNWHHRDTDANNSTIFSMRHICLVAQSCCSREDQKHHSKSEDTGKWAIVPPLSRCTFRCWYTSSIVLRPRPLPWQPLNQRGSEVQPQRDLIWSLPHRSVDARVWSWPVFLDVLVPCHRSVKG